MLPKQNRNTVGEKQIKFLVSLITMVMIGYICLGFGHIMGWSSTEIFKNPIQSTYEFMPVMIIGMCSFYILFTCGEFFGLLRYEFTLDEDAPGKQGLRLIAVRSLSVFFVSVVCFYFLRIGFEEVLLEKIFLSGLPFLIGIYLIIILGRLYRAHFMPHWYFRQKRILLIFCVFSELLANTFLFFPEILVKIPLTS